MPTLSLSVGKFLPYGTIFRAGSKAYRQLRYLTRENQGQIKGKKRHLYGKSNIRLYVSERVTCQHCESDKLSGREKSLAT